MALGLEPWAEAMQLQMSTARQLFSQATSFWRLTLEAEIGLLGSVAPVSR